MAIFRCSLILLAVLAAPASVLSQTPCEQRLPYALVCMGDIQAEGNICISGHVHANGDVDFGPNDDHLTCGGTHSEGFEIGSPAIYTEPEYFPNATYYYVRGRYTPKGGPTIPAKTEALIFDRNGNDITASLPNVLTPLTTYDTTNHVFRYNIDGNISGIPAVDYFFGQNSSVLRARCRPHRGRCELWHLLRKHAVDR